jgi:hypothetical protein
MNKLLTIILLVLPVCSYSQTTEDTAAKRAITGSGKADGKLSEAKIGKEGGTLFSADKKIELIFPVGALSKKTNISIQPISNLMPNGNGKAYRLQPSGIQFQKSAELIFHYDDDESKDSMQLLMGIAMQDNIGQWYNLNATTLDTVAKTIRGNINQFSDWSKFDAIKLYPSSARVKVKKQLEMTIDLISENDNELVQLGSDELAPLVKRKISWTPAWRVNEIINGNNTVGSISAYSKIAAVYKAPSNVPSKNPVAVTVDLKGLSYNYKGITFRDLKLVSNILVYDNAWEVTMITSNDGSAGSELGMANYKDNGSFVVSLESGTARMVEKLNNNQVDELGYKGKCTVVLLKAGSGNIHITGTKSIKVIPPSPPAGNAWIVIEFIKAPLRLSLLQITCPPIGKGGPTTITTAQGNAMMASMMSALPQLIKFEAKEEDQTIYEVGKEGDETYVKFTVKKLKED